MAINNKQGMDLLTSFGPSVLQALLGGGNKVDKDARARNDLANVLEVQNNASTGTADLSQQGYNNFNDSRQTFGKNALEDVTVPTELSRQAQADRLKGAIFPQIPGLFKTNIQLPAGSTDIYSRLGTDEYLADRLKSASEGMSMRNPLSGPMQASLAAGSAGSRVQPQIDSFNTTRRSEFQNQEQNMNSALMNAISGIQDSSKQYQSGLQGLQKQEQDSGGGGFWKSLLGLAPLALMPFTGGLSAALAPILGGSTAAAAGAIGAGAGALGALGGGSNPLTGALMGGATGALVGPGGKFGQKVIPNNINPSQAGIPGTMAGMPEYLTPKPYLQSNSLMRGLQSTPMTGSRRVLQGQ
jgi:hypothetical protein